MGRLGRQEPTSTDLRETLLRITQNSLLVNLFRAGLLPYGEPTRLLRPWRP